MEALPATPIAPETPKSKRSWIELWRLVWLNPGVESFWSILKDMDHSATRGLIWIGVASFITGLVSALFSIRLYNRMVEQLGGISSGQGVGTTLCTIILTPFGVIIGTVILTGLYHLLSRIFKGNGNWSDLLFCWAAIAAPSSIITTIFSAITGIFSGINVLFFLFAILFGIVGVALFVYVIILQVLAIKASENVSTGGAIGTLLIPYGLIIVLTICCVLTLVPVFYNAVQQ